MLPNNFSTSTCFAIFELINIELKSIVAQHENLAAKGIFGVRVPLQFYISFPLNKNNPRDFFTDQ